MAIPSYLEELDKLLLDQSDDCMLLSELDGFLTGIITCPDLIPPSKWLQYIWGGEHGDAPLDMPNMAGFQRLVDLVMRHYNAIITDLNQPGSYGPLFDIDARNGDTLWEPWIEGFTTAMDLAPAAWHKVIKSDDPAAETAISGIKTLHALASGPTILSKAEQDRWLREAPDLIAIWVEVLHSWRLEHDVHRPVHSTKTGRNDPCPCGSGKKYKKCCGLN
jgi:uncharacterized protein